MFIYFYLHLELSRKFAEENNYNWEIVKEGLIAGEAWAKNNNKAVQKNKRDLKEQADRNK